MSEKNLEVLVKDYLKQVKSKLPDWLKEDKNEVREIMSQLEEHLWFKAEELSDIGQPTEESIRLAIAHMGSPQTIANEYKRRGTPYVYITKELWPIYTKILFILFMIVLAINIISVVISMIEGDLWAVFDLFGMFSSFAVIFTIITLIFVALSKEGYLPEDFKSKKELKKEERELEKAKEMGLPISLKTGEQLKPFIKPAEKIVEGILGIGFGFFLLAFPIPVLADLIHPDFLFFIRIGGLIVIIEGCLDLVRGLMGNKDVSLHQRILIILILLDLISIPIVIYIFSRPEILPFFVFQGDQFVNLGIDPDFYYIVNIIYGVVIFFTIVGAMENIYNYVKLEKYKVKY